MKKTTTMTCGDCNIKGSFPRSQPCYLCIYDGVVALITSGWSNNPGPGRVVSGPGRAWAVY